MSHDPTYKFQYQTLNVYPKSLIDNGEGGFATPKKEGYTLLDESPGFTGIYVRDVNGGLFPARTVDRSLPAHYKSVCDSWLTREGAEDRRTFKEPTHVDNLRGNLERAGIRVIMKSDGKLVSDSDGFYERFGSDACSHVGFEAQDWGDGVLEITVKCPAEFGGKIEKYAVANGSFSDGVKRLINIFAL